MAGTVEERLKRVEESMRLLAHALRMLAMRMPPAWQETGVDADVMDATDSALEALGL